MSPVELKGVSLAKKKLEGLTAESSLRNVWNLHGKAMQIPDLSSKTCEVSQSKRTRPKTAAHGKCKIRMR